jgi:hypothetical protein
LGNTVTTLNNLTLANVTITSGTSNVTNVNVTNVTVTNLTATLANVTTLNVASAYITSANIGTLALTNALPVSSGGTGQVTFPANSVLLGNGTGGIATVSPGNVGNVLTSIGGVWVSNVAVSGAAAGANTQVQYNNSGALGASANLTFNGTTLTANTLNLTNALGTTYGGTGLTSFTANGVVYASSSSVLATGSALTFDGTNLMLGTTSVLNPVTNFRSFQVTGTNGGILDFGTNSTIYGRTSADSNGMNVEALGFTPIVFRTSLAERMRLDSSGNLGIGGTANNYAGFKTLAVIGPDATHSGIVRVRTSDDAIGMNIYADSTGPLFNTTNNPLRFLISDTERMRLDSSGNLGLGVTPSAWGSSDKAIDIGGGNQSSISANLAGAFGTNAYFNGTDWKYKNSTGSPGLYSQSFDGQHKWFRASSGTAGNTITFTQAMTLDASGNLLVGQTSTGLKTTRSMGFTITGACVQQISHSTTDVSGDSYVEFGYNGTKIGSITQNGTTGVLYNVTSDYRLKTVIGPVANAGQRIDALKPVEYKWKSDNSSARGFLAHEFQEVYPNSVTGTKDSVDADGNPVYQNMQASTSEVIADLVTEIQSLRIRIAQLEAKP